MRGGILTDRVAEHDVGADAKGFQQPGERDLDGEDGGRGILRAAQLIDRLLVRDIGPQHVPKRFRQLKIRVCDHLGEGFADDRIAPRKVAGHVHALTALAGEEEGDAGIPDLAGELPGISGRKPFELRGEVGRVAREQGVAHAVGGALATEGARERLGVGAAPDQGPQLLGTGDDRGRAVPGNDHGHDSVCRSASFDRARGLAAARV